ncbi:hypothetical protein PFX98_16310 [Paucibacter sediminis]|uniref:Uncharacterized protein n=1 Tax=Paucibacter sediminis TaxID=3019553 RepID=A0AA95NB58_9BURK|nr:hypothetical protein [Paucibacter sp. S2-9]WIT10468.1 hypothetical protein PFX98_16310 [Paucibacter sp. S2-9]
MTFSIASPFTTPINTKFCKVIVTTSNLRDEYIALTSLFSELSFAELADLIDTVPMRHFDAFGRFKQSTTDQVNAVRTWLAKFAAWYMHADDYELGNLDSELEGADSISNCNGFVLSELVRGSPLIRSAYDDEDSSLGATLRAIRAYADAVMQAPAQLADLPSHLARRAKALEGCSERDHAIGMHILRLIAAHDRGEANCVPNLERATLAKRVVGDIEQARLAMADGQRIRSKKGGGALSHRTITRDVITKFKLLG